MQSNQISFFRIWPASIFWPQMNCLQPIWGSNCCLFSPSCFRKKNSKIFLYRVQKNLVNNIALYEEKNFISPHPDPLNSNSEILTHLHDFKMVISSPDSIKTKKFSKIWNLHKILIYLVTKKFSNLQVLNITLLFITSDEMKSFHNSSLKIFLFKNQDIST